jgi:uncharacterized membrane protein
MSTRSVRLSFLALCVFASALISGFFYAYFCSVMPGLAATDPETAIKAMQGINAVVRNGTFAFSFFGTLAFGAIAIFLLIGAGGWPLALALAGTAIYGIGAFMVTLLLSVPLNEGLATVTPTPENARPDLARLLRAVGDVERIAHADVGALPRGIHGKLRRPVRAALHGDADQPADEAADGLMRGSTAYAARSSFDATVASALSR